MQLQHLIVNLANSPIRREKLQGRDYVVAPMAMITAGVHNGSNGPLLYEEADIKKAVPAWNMKPIVVYHPTINNKGVTAADPDVLERQQVGIVMNTSFKGGKLRAEAWIEEDLANKVDDRVMDALENNRMMEVSTGLFTDNESSPGKLGDEEYTYIARNHQPDHLALLPDQIGACSIADGAGLLQLNAEGVGFEGAEVMEIARRIVGNKMSHSNIHAALSRALEEKVPRVKKGTGETAYTVSPWIMDVYDKFFVYEMGNKLYRLHYTNGKAGVEITGDADEVVRVTEYRTADTRKFVGNNHAPKQKQKGTNTMNKKEIVDGLISNAETQWGEEDRETLMALDDSVLNKMGMKKKDAAADGGDPEEVEETAKGKNKPVKNEGAESEQAGEGQEPVANTTEAYIENAPPEIQQVLRNGLDAHTTEQARLIKEITANNGNTFSKEFLQTKGLDELRGIAALAKAGKPTENQDQRGAVPMFVGQATPAAPVTNADEGAEEALAAPTMNFEKKEG